jgi:transcription-repair coupling factor (superfamily II helicase)
VSLAGLLSVIGGDPALRDALASAGPAGAGPDAGDFTAPPALRPFLAAALTGLPGERGQQASQDRRFVLAVTASAREAEELTDALTSLLPGDGVAYFPAWETLPHERISPGSDTSGRRIAVLRRLAHPDPASPRTGPLSVVVTPVRGLLQPIVGGLGDIAPVSLRPGQAVGLDEVIAGLVDIGYTRTDLVERRGEMAVRGGIVDVFPPTEEHPLRVEFFGDEVEEIRQFRVADQRSLQAVDELWVPPCRELLLTPAVRERAKQLAADHPGLADVLGKLADGIVVEGMEAFAPAIASRMELLLDHVPAGGRVLACDPERIRARAADLVRTSQEFLAASWVNAAAGGQAPIDLGAAAFRSITQVRAAADGLGLPWWTVTPFESPGAAGDEAGRDGRSGEGRRAGSGDDAHGGADEDEPGRPAFRIGASPAEGYRGDTARALADVRRWLAGQWRVVLVTEGHGPAQRLAEMLRGEGLGARLGDLDDPPEPGVPCVTTGLISNGFTWEAARLAVICEADLAGQRTGSRDTRRMPSRRRGGIDPLQLTPGDYVVHEQHGVGRYLEMTSRSVQGAVREYLVIEYAPGKRGQPPDRLYVPTDQLDQVTRYVGGEAPALHRLGGADWAKTKGRARKAVRQIASELIRLYSARMASAGHAFGLDTPWQRELEDAFPYVETPDQLGAIDEVKHDMERPVPMDRLICGDVGYGKTEIAVRAAFKAVQDGKQVAVLVPTTLLAAQHYSTFSDRYAPFPVVVRQLSRFQSDAEAAATLAGLADGTVDVVIGTHRLLSPETRFARLGLVVLDEEQRFGVEHKEYLKRLRTEVDVLAMSATPIPRTLEMGVAGIREMSTILTPPEERHPVLTLVGPYDEKQIAASCSETARRSSCTTGSPRSARSPPGSPSWCPRPGWWWRTAR